MSDKRFWGSEGDCNYKGFYSFIFESLKSLKLSAWRHSEDFPLNFTKQLLNFLSKCLIKIRFSLMFSTNCRWKITLVRCTYKPTHQTDIPCASRQYRLHCTDCVYVNEVINSQHAITAVWAPVLPVSLRKMGQKWLETFWGLGPITWTLHCICQWSNIRKKQEGAVGWKDKKKVDNRYWLFILPPPTLQPRRLFIEGKLRYGKIWQSYIPQISWEWWKRAHGTVSQGLSEGSQAGSRWVGGRMDGWI